MIRDPATTPLEAFEAYTSRLPIPRLGRTDDVVALMLFLASTESAYCTGAEFVVDGGQTCGPRSSEHSQALPVQGGGLAAAGQHRVAAAGQLRVASARKSSSSSPMRRWASSGCRRGTAGSKW